MNYEKNPVSLSVSNVFLLCILNSNWVLLTLFVGQIILYGFFTTFSVKYEEEMVSQQKLSNRSVNVLKQSSNFERSS